MGSHLTCGRRFSQWPMTYVQRCIVWRENFFDSKTLWKWHSNIIKIHINIISDIIAKKNVLASSFSLHMIGSYLESNDLIIDYSSPISVDAYSREVTQIDTNGLSLLLSWLGGTTMPVQHHRCQFCSSPQFIELDKNAPEANSFQELFNPAFSVLIQL